jgi:hypothetical protein
MAVSQKYVLAAMGVLCLAGLTADAQTTTAASAPTAAKKPKAASRTAMAVWTPEVLKAFGIYPSDFASSGLNKLTKPQLTTLLAAVQSGAGKHVLTCPANGAAPTARTHVLLTVAGEDSTGQIANSIRSAISQLPGVDVVTDAANADRALHVVIQEQTMNKRTIGFTAAYVTASPCSDSFQGKSTAVELKGELGTYTDPKGADLAQDLAKMFGQDLKATPQPVAASSN